MVEKLKEDLAYDIKQRDEWVKSIKEKTNWVNLAEKRIKEMTDLINLLEAREKNGNGR